MGNCCVSEASVRLGLADALEEGSADKLELALLQARALAIDEEELEEAEAKLQQLKASSELKAALASDSADRLEVAIAGALAHSIDVEEAEVTLKRWRCRDKIQALKAESEIDVVDLNAEIKVGESLGLDESELGEARSVVSGAKSAAQEEISAARTAKDAKLLASAIRKGELACVGKHELRSAQAELAVLRAGIWEEEPSGDPRKGSWRPFSKEVCQLAEQSLVIFEACDRKRGRRATLAVTKSSMQFTIDFQLMTCLKVRKEQESTQKENELAEKEQESANTPNESTKGRHSSVVVPIRRLEKDTREQTHPDPGQNHPWFNRKVALAEKDEDWLTNEYFWKAFCECCRKAGREVVAKPEDLFDFQHNRDYRGWTGASTETRGGLDYTLPSGWKRFACRVKDKFGDDNKWLRLDGGAGEWAIAYHGTSYEAIVPILDGGLMSGKAQVYEQSKDVRTGETIGRGVYCSPSIAVAERYANSRGTKGGTDIDGHNVFFVLQCRVNPNKLKRCHDEAKIKYTDTRPYWVLNDSADIRPYGILVKECDR